MANPEPNATSKPPNRRSPRMLVAIAVGLLALILSVAHDAAELKELNEHVSGALRGLMPDKVIEAWVSAEARCAFDLEAGKSLFTRCGDRADAGRFPPHVCQAPAWLCVIGTILKQPAVILVVVGDTLGWLALPILFLALLIGSTIAGDTVVPAYAAATLVALLGLYAVILLASALLYGLSLLLGEALGFLAFVWSSISIGALAFLFPYEAQKKVHEIAELLGKKGSHN